MKQTILISIVITMTLQLFATNNVAITEIMYDTPLNEDITKSPHNYGEFIELYNNGRESVDLSGWKIETISPYQEFTFPIGISLPPHIPLVVAYGDSVILDYIMYDMTEEEFMSGMTGFHGIYEITDVNMCQVHFQTSLTLPNQYTRLVLKDAFGVTQDSIIYEDPYPGSLNNARNEDMDMLWLWKGCLTSTYSLQRQRVRPKADGSIKYAPEDWIGKLTNMEDLDCPPNSAGIVTTSFDENNPVITVNSSNFIQETTPLSAMSRIDTAQLSIVNAIVKRTHYDAMYRPTLTFLYDQTPDHKNLVTLNEYDEYTRPVREWLPIATEERYLTYNTFKAQAGQYYSTDVRPFIENSYSTARWDNGIIKNELIGTQKAGSDMSGHKMIFVSRGNIANEVKLFTVTSNGSLECNGFYDEHTLLVVETTDEDEITKVIYKNLRNQIIMEKIDNAMTYYVYNDLNQLCYVLPPLAVNQLGDGEYNEDEDILKKYAYVYKYDERGNQIYKRLPGCEPIRMVYDKSNALVLSQTGNQRAHGTYWTVYKYDSLRRLIYTAEVKVGSNNHDAQIDDFSRWLVKEQFYKEEPQYPMSNTGYSRGFFDVHPIKLLTVNYYDNYDFLTWMSDTVKNHMEFSEFEDNISSANANGLLTGTRTYYLTGAEGYTETVYYYDYRGREIQRRSTNHLGGYDVLSTKYDFANNVTDTWSSQSTSNGITTAEHYHYEYDHANRLSATTYSYNDEPSIELQTYHYDELGRVHSRHIHGGIDSIAFAYDIRNQVTQIKSSGYEQNYYYNQSCPSAEGHSEELYNGNISATTWTYGNQINGYTYTYDNMNRLSSTYSILNNSLNVDYLYSEKFTYDPHGNITSLERWDEDNNMDNLAFTYNGNQLHSIDDGGVEAYRYDTKHYHDNSNSSNDFAYDANGNMIYDQDRGIAAIRYNLLNLPDTIQFTNGNLIIHRYDAAGNRLETKYLTKKIAAIVQLEQVLKIPVHPLFFYITRDAFHNNIVYTANNTDAYGIEFVHNPEGYIRYYGVAEHYHHYHIKDLLGNIRETYIHPDANYKECVERTQYYPSGLPWAERLSDGFTAHPWKYNGKEFVEMHGLDEYDSKARWYYPAICRTTTMDPLAEKYYSISPYAWCRNNPIRFVDPEGKDVYHYNHNTGVFSLYEKTDDKYDVIGKFKYNAEIGKYEPQMQEDGSIKTYSDHLGNNDKIAKGILKNNLNIKEKGGYIILDQTRPTLDDIYNFALILDEVAGIEISGFVLEAPVEKNKKIVQFEPYKDNSTDKSRTRIMDFAPYNVLQHFHTHGHADTYTVATTPSKLDLNFKNNKAAPLWPSIQLLILHNYGSPIKY